MVKRELALFAGAGGGILAGRLMGWRTVCAVELDPYARRVLVERQNDRSLEPFPIWDDVRTFDGRPWRSRVDIVSGGFPCQDVSAAGKGAGIDGPRSGLWREMARLVGEVRPAHVLVENSPLLVSRGLSVVLADLAGLGYDARWGIVSAHDVGAPHLRRRIWIVATDSERDGLRLEQQRPACGRLDIPPCGQAVALDDGAPQRVADAHGRRCESEWIAQHDDKQGPRGDKFDGCCSGRWGPRTMADADDTGRPQQRIGQPNPAQRATAERSGWWCVEPAVGRVANGLADRVGQLRALGNGQVPSVARLAWSLLSETD